MLPLACHPSSLHMEAYIEQARGRLEKNLRLQRQIERESATAWVRHNGVIRRAIMPPLDDDKIKDLVRHIGIGLAFHHFGVLLDGRAVVDVVPALEQSFNFIRKNGASYSGDRVAGNLGNGTAFYVAGFDTGLRRIAMVVNFFGGVRFTRRNDRKKTVFSGWIVTIDLPHSGVAAAA